MQPACRGLRRCTARANATLPAGRRAASGAVAHAPRTLAAEAAATPPPSPPPRAWLGAAAAGLALAGCGSLALWAGGAGGGAAQCPQPAQLLGGAPLADKGAVRGLEAIADAVEVSIPALVNIAAVRKGPWGSVIQSVGSGFVIREDGLIATNAHVVQQSAALSVTLYDGRQYKAKVLSFDLATDLALILVDEPLEAPLPVMAFGRSSELRLGQVVVALGSPLNLSSSATMGIVSSLARGGAELGLSHAPRTEYLQTDAAINQGNSGGPLINLRGEVVGINSMKVAQGESIGFAIPSDTAVIVLAQLRDHGRVTRPFIGLRMAQINKALARYERRANRNFPDVDAGVLVVSVAPDSPASRAGLQPGDVIVSFNDKPAVKIDEITRAIGYDVGRTHSVGVLRGGGQRAELHITTSAM
jgi:HtrA serine peptidase 2